MEEVVGRFIESVVELTTRTPEHPVFAWLASQGKVRRCERCGDGSDGWTSLRATIAGDRDAAAEVLNIITAAGVRVGSFAFVPPTLAELIQRMRHAAPTGEPAQVQAERRAVSEVRPEKVEQARAKIAEESYPPDYLLDRIAVLLAIQIKG